MSYCLGCCHGSALTTPISGKEVGSCAESRLPFVRPQLRPHFRPQEFPPLLFPPDTQGSKEGRCPQRSPVTPKETERGNGPLIHLPSPFSLASPPLPLTDPPILGGDEAIFALREAESSGSAALASTPKSRETRRPTCAPGKPRRSLSPGWQRGGRTVSEGSWSRLCAGPRDRAICPQELVPGTAGSPARGRSAPWSRGHVRAAGPDMPDRHPPGAQRVRWAAEG